MPNVEDIIDNIANYTPAEIAGYIRDGIVTYSELCEEPEFSARARHEVKALLNNSEEEDWRKAVEADTVEAYNKYLNSYPEGSYRDNAREAKQRLAQQSVNDKVEDVWNSINKKDGNQLRTFVATYPESSHVAEAKALITQISRATYSKSDINRFKDAIANEKDPNEVIGIIKAYLNNGSISISDFYNEIRENHNLVPSKVIDRLQAESIIDFWELETNAGINPKFLEYITNNNVNSPVIDVEFTPIESIGEKTTEVYFWGIPSSGKTCALGAIMSEARHGDYIDFAEPDNNCQGYNYMTVLSQVFEGGTDVFKLPEGTQTDAIFEMGYTLKKDKKDYPVTFIDLAGETIDSMYLKDARLPLSPKKQSGLDTACRLLTGNPKINRKIHFFVLEYNGHNKKYKGRSQDTLLKGAMTFIQNTGIFKTETDAVYILITKSDLTGATSAKERNAILKEYIKTHYKQFYNGLRILCENNEINGGQVEIIPFSLGDVCFQNLCLFNNTTAKTVVELILHRAKGFKTGKISTFTNLFKK